MHVVRSNAGTPIALLVGLLALLGSSVAEESASTLPRGPEPEPVATEHFPSRLHAYVWRNWGLLPAERLAEAIQASADEIRGIATSMGLPADPSVDGEMERRGYLTILRRNWHLLGYDQLLKLLRWDEEKLAFTLREDDFLWIKLGSLKPRCPPLEFHRPSKEEETRCQRIRETLSRSLGETWSDLEEPRFQFVRELASPPISETSRPESARSPGDGAPRFLYAYFALYGDPLAHPEIDPYPDGYLQRLADLGVNGVWLQGVLRNLAPSPLFPEDGPAWERRLENLSHLVDRAARHGLGVYLYFNEPRSQPLEFYETRPGLRGVQEGDRAALCTSTPELRSFLRDGAAMIFRKVPKLRGLFTITASENLTSCHSHGRGDACPRCKERAPAAVIAEVNSLLAEGAWSESPEAEVIAWDWGWADAWVPAILDRLPKRIRLQSVSEWSLPITRGGIPTVVGEYSISAVGPGPRALRHWELAKERGLRFGAKVQINNTWELSTVPYIPAMELVAQHLYRLRETGASSLMLSWTLGGYPSPNLEVARAYFEDERPTPEEALRAVALRRYGDGAADALQAWRRFSRAFESFPFDIRVLYHGPQQLGPANLPFPRPTGYRATMVGFPYDDVDSWRGPFPPETFAGQFDAMTRGWKEGIARLETAVRKAPESERSRLHRDLDVARACALHFESTALQVRYVIERNRYWKSQESDGPTTTSSRREIRGILEREMELARDLYRIANRDSRIGFEASNQYVYLPLDLAEKVLACHYLLEDVFSDAGSGNR